MASRLGESDQDLQHFVSQSPWSADVLLEALARTTAPRHLMTGSSTRRASRRRELTQRVCNASPAARWQKGQRPVGGQPATAPTRRWAPASRCPGGYFCPKAGRSIPCVPAGGHPARRRPPEQAGSGLGTVRPGSRLEVTGRRGARRRRPTAAASSGAWPCASANSFTACACRGRPPAGRRKRASGRPRRCAGAFGRSVARGSAPSQSLCSPSPASCPLRVEEGDLATGHQGAATLALYLL